MTGHVTRAVLTCVRGQVRAGGGAVDASRVVLEGGWLLVVLHDGFQVARTLLVAEVKGQGATTEAGRGRGRAACDKRRSSNWSMEEKGCVGMEHKNTTTSQKLQCRTAATELSWDTASTLKSSLITRQSEFPPLQSKAEQSRAKGLLSLLQPSVMNSDRVACDAANGNPDVNCGAIRAHTHTHAQSPNVITIHSVSSNNAGFSMGDVCVHDMSVCACVCV